MQQYSLKGEVSRIFLKNIDLYKSNRAQSSLLGRGGVFPPANDSGQMRVRAPRSTATGCCLDWRKLWMWTKCEGKGMYLIRRNDKWIKKYMYNIYLFQTETLGLGLSRFGALKERLGRAMQSWPAFCWKGRC